MYKARTCKVLITFFCVYLDNDECATDNGNCDDICVNSLGSFHCSCQEGFSLTSNGIDCEGEPTITFCCDQRVL